MFVMHHVLLLKSRLPNNLLLTLCCRQAGNSQPHRPLMLRLEARNQATCMPCPTHNRLVSAYRVVVVMGGGGGGGWNSVFPLSWQTME